MDGVAEIVCPAVQVLGLRYNGYPAFNDALYAGIPGLQQKLVLGERGRFGIMIGRLMADTIVHGSPPPEPMEK
jgi:hypothetical protein